MFSFIYAIKTNSTKYFLFFEALIPFVCLLKLFVCFQKWSQNFTQNTLSLTRTHIHTCISMYLYISQNRKELIMSAKVISRHISHSIVLMMPKSSMKMKHFICFISTMLHSYVVIFYLKIFLCVKKGRTNERIVSKFLRWEEIILVYFLLRGARKKYTFIYILYFTYITALGLWKFNGNFKE